MSVGTHVGRESRGFRLTKISSVELLVALCLLGMSGLLGYFAFLGWRYNSEFGNALVHRGRNLTGEALTSAKNATKMDPDHADSSLFVAQLMYEGNQLPDAVEAIQEAAATSAGRWNELAVTQCAIVMSDPGQAKTAWPKVEALLQEVLGRDPNYASAHALLGQFRVNEGNYYGDPDSARDHFEQALSAWQSLASGGSRNVNRNDATYVPNAMLCVVAYNGLGMCAFVEGKEKRDVPKVDEAIQHFRSALTYRLPWLAPAINLERAGALAIRLRYEAAGDDLVEIGAAKLELVSMAPEFGYFTDHTVAASPRSGRTITESTQVSLFPADFTVIDANRAATQAQMADLLGRKLILGDPAAVVGALLGLNTHYANAIANGNLDFPAWNWFILICKAIKAEGNGQNRTLYLMRMRDSLKLFNAAHAKVTVEGLRDFLDADRELAYWVNTLSLLGADFSRVAAAEPQFRISPLGSPLVTDRVRRIRELLESPDLSPGGPKPRAGYIELIEHFASPTTAFAHYTANDPPNLDTLAPILGDCAAFVCRLPPASGRNEALANAGLGLADERTHSNRVASIPPLRSPVHGELELMAIAADLFLAHTMNYLQRVYRMDSDLEAREMLKLAARCRLRILYYFRAENVALPSVSNTVDHETNLVIAIERN